MPNRQRLISCLFRLLTTFLLLVFRQSTYRPLLGCLVLSLLVGCNETTDCGTDSAAQFTAVFVKKGSTDFGSTFAVKFDSIMIIEERLILDTNITASTLSLPINPTTDVTTYRLVRAGTLVDTIQLIYQRKYQLVSPDCSPTIDFTEIKLTFKSNAADSLVIINNATDSSQNNVQIYL